MRRSSAAQGMLSAKCFWPVIVITRIYMSTDVVLLLCRC